MKVRTKQYTILSLVLILAFGVYFYSTTVAFVGWNWLTKDEVQLRSKLYRIYEPEETRDLGEFLMIRSLVRYEVLKKNGIDISEEEIEAESKRIEKETVAPEKLQKIKALFNGDEDDYMYIFVFTTLVERKIYALLNNGVSKELGQKSYSAAQKFIDQVSGGDISQFFNVVQSSGGVPREVEVSSVQGLKWKDPFAPPEKRKYKNTDQYVQPNLAQEWITNFLNQMKAGQILDKPVDMKNMWAVLLMDAPQKSKDPQKETRYKLKAGLFLKDDPSQWLEAQEKQIKVWKF